MYRSLSILFLSFISLCAWAQNDTLSNNAAIFQQTDPIKANHTVSAQDLSGTQEELIQKAAVLYTNRHFTAAAAVYEKVATQYGTSDKLYYNLGNAYYKSKDLPSAILNYERALKINPSDRDTRFNLAMCQARIIDKIEPIGMFMFTRWSKSLENSFNSNTWGYFSILFFLILIASLFLYFFTRVTILKKISFFTSILALIISLLSLFYAGEQHEYIVNPDQAILFSPTVTIKSSPDQSGTDIFVLHEGSKVTILSTLGTWSEIELIDGNIGWLETKHIRTI